MKTEIPSNAEGSCGHSCQRTMLIACVILVCVAAMLRGSYLGDADFGLDEILHVYVAEQLADGNPPLLPSGHRYTRGLPYSYLIALFGTVGGFEEHTLRLLSVAFGVAMVGLVYMCAARWFTPSAGLAAATLMAFSPIQLALSREVRMYTMFQCCFLLIVFLFYEGFEVGPSAHRRGSRPSWAREWTQSWEIRPMWLGAALALFVLAWALHILIVPAVAGVVVYLCVMALLAVGTTAFTSAVRLKYVVAGCGVVVGAVLCWLLFPEKVAKLLAMPNAQLSWGKEHVHNWNYYRWLLVDEYPLVVGLFSVSAVLCIIRQPRLGMFLCAVLIVPLLLHSTWFPNKSFRYIGHLLPVMFIIAGVGFAEIFFLVWRAAQGLGAQLPMNAPLWRALALSGLLIVIGGVLVNMPWFMRTIKDYKNHYHEPHVTDVQHHHWRTAMRYIGERQRSGDVMISGYPLLARHYGASMPLYFMNDAYVRTNEGYDYRNHDGALLDYTLGVPVLRTLDEVRRVVSDAPSGWFVTYKWRNERFWNHPNRPTRPLGTFPPEVIDHLRTAYQEHSIPGAPYLAVWRWGGHGGTSQKLREGDKLARPS